MAYRNLVAENLTPGATSEAEWFMRMRDFVCKRNATYDYSTTGIGWTLYDWSYAVNENNAAINDWIVLYSAGELGVDKMYYKITLIQDYITIWGYQSWNSSTNTGVGAYYRDNAMQIGADPEQIYIYGDLDFVHLVAVGVAANTNWYCGAFGMLETNYLIPLEGVDTPRNVQICSTSLTAGSAVSIVVPNSSSNLWRVGNSIIIMDDTYLEKITVITNDGAGTITANLTNSYSAGSKICVSFPYFVAGQNTTNFYRSGYCVFLHDLMGNHAGGVQEAATIAVITNATYFNLNLPAGWNQAFAIQPYGVYDATYGYIGNIPTSGYIIGTGLANYDLLDDVTASGVQWRYVSTTNPRVYKEV